MHSTIDFFPGPARKKTNVLLYIRELRAYYPSIYTLPQIQGPFIYTVAISDTLYFRVSKIRKTFSIAVCPSKNKEVEK